MKSALNKDSLNSIISEIFNTNQYNLVDSTQTLNNHIYKIHYRNNYYSLKFYRKYGDKYKNKRMRIETNALNLLRENNLNNVPQVFGLSKKYNCAIFTWIEGKNITRFNTKYIDQAISFQKRIKRIGKSISYRKVNIGIGTFFSAKGLLLDIEERYRLLTTKCDKNFSLFLKKEFYPIYQKASNLIKYNFIRNKIGFDKDTLHKNRVLTQQDFGFQNCLVKDGKLFFVDFEYFGWDDPVKFTADTLQHPNLVNISTNLKYFSREFYKVYVNSSFDKKRFSFVYNLHGLRWCLIVGNIFLRSKHVSSSRKNEKINLIRGKIKDISSNLDMDVPSSFALIKN